MKDQRIDTLAKGLINYSCSLKKGEKVLIEAKGIDYMLVNALIKEAYKVGAYPFVEIYDNRVTRELMMGLTEEQAKLRAKYDGARMAEMHTYIGIRGGENCNELSDVPEKNAKGKGVKKGYLWTVIGMKSRMMYVLYEDGSRSTDVIVSDLSGYRGTIQSDGYTAYRTLQGDGYPSIERIACLQHVKRKFIDCGEDPQAKTMVGLMNGLYKEEHRHKVGKDGWTVEDNLRHREEYSPPILEEIKEELQKIRTDSTLPPTSELAAAAVYMENEWEAIEGIFKRGDTELDNNQVERYNRYFSISRRNSLFFGSHAGAGRAAVLYTIALSCRMHEVDFFEYLKFVLEKTAEWQPNTPLEKYRELLPDKFKYK